MLARLLATENISVVHQNIPTAFFDLKTRSLHLPMWSNASGSLYDMLVGHEVAHALYTPAAGWKSGIDSISAATGCSKDTAKQYLNIVEDARIERMIQTKFRGLKADFINAYKTLMEREFFGDLSNLHEAIFADRFNIHFKCGIHAGTVVRFSVEESAFVTRGETTATWADVVSLAQDMIVWAQERAAQQQQGEQPVAVEGGEDGDGSVDVSDAGEPSAEEDNTDSNAGSGEGTERESDSPSNADTAEADAPAQDAPEGEAQSSGATGKPKTSNAMSNTDPIAPVTNSALEAALEQFAKADSENIEEIVRVTTADLSQCAKTVDYTQVLTDMRGSAMSRYMAQPVRISDYTTASVTMATAFNRRKAADNWRRTTVAKSGSLDTLRMNQYKWTDDIFRRTTRLADGKNHGIVILLDWSASMSNIMQSTMGQLFILADFCRKCSIPFEVYAFSDMGYYATKDGFSKEGQAERDAVYAADHERRAASSVNTRSVVMLNLLSSRMNGSDYEAMKSCLWNWRQMGTCDYRYGLNGTPTTAALVAAADLVEGFIKRTRVQIAHTVVLTDGEPTDQMEFNWTKFDKSGYRSTSRTAVVLTDHRTGASYDLNRVQKWTKDAHGYRKSNGYFQFGTNGIPETVGNPHSMIAVDIVRRRTGAKMHWIGLVSHARRGVDPARWGMVCKTNEWKRDGFVRGDVWGWDSAIVVDSDRFHRDANGEISQNAQSVLDKAESKMDSASTKGALAKAFMESQMAHGALRTVATHIGEHLAV